ncbi:C40 family peptidase [uncultured Hymenobacter sp.]|uniref:C40 family peptidase n=1 Tax=uncultured Hymenobacter sp. TaxID=170016 RepID=UPI0035CA6812
MKTKIRPAASPAPTPRRRAGLASLALLLLLLAASCQQKLNYRDGRYHSARDMVRLKKAGRGRGGRESRPVVRSKVKTRYDRPSGQVVTRSRTRIEARRPRPANTSDAIAAVIEEARSYEGTPYLYGGTTRLGVDCSGLLQLSFGAVDIAIPRSSNEQAGWGEPVRPNELQPGDLLFFGPSPGSGTITHVGLVTEASQEEIRFIHASTSLGVVENSLETDYYLSRFVRAVRPRL